MNNWKDLVGKTYTENYSSKDRTFTLAGVFEDNEGRLWILSQYEGQNPIQRQIRHDGDKTIYEETIKDGNSTKWHKLSELYFPTILTEEEMFWKKVSRHDI